MLRPSPNHGGKLRLPNDDDDAYFNLKVVPFDIQYIRSSQLHITCVPAHSFVVVCALILYPVMVTFVSTT